MRIRRSFQVLLPMILGSAIGSVSALFPHGLEAVLGMMAGSMAWMAYELRRNTQQGKKDFEQLERGLKFFNQSTESPETRHWRN
jgi:hypothetical protein